MYAHGWVLLALLLVGVALLAVAVAWGLRGSGGGSGLGGSGSGGVGGRQDGHRRAVEILDERYARGELDTSEFQERLRELGGR